MKLNKFVFAFALAACSGFFAGTQLSAQDAAKTSIVDINMVEKAPAFPGGTEALTKHLIEQVKYPEACRASKAKGIVKVGFTVDASGRVMDVTNLGDPEMDNRLINEAFRVVEALPNWEPAVYKGQKVACKMVLPISFQPN